MNTGKLILAIAVGVFSVSMMCNDTAVDAPPPLAIGAWELPMSLAPIIPEPLYVALTISTDSRFTLKLTRQPSTTLYSSEGTWKTTGDSIFLLGSTCLVIDAVPDPDSLKNLGDSLCKLPIPLKLPTSADTWNIETQKLAGMLSGFPVPKEILDGFLPLMPLLTMTRVPAL